MHPEHYAKPGSNVRLWHLADIYADSEDVHYRAIGSQRRLLTATSKFLARNRKFVREGPPIWG